MANKHAIQRVMWEMQFLFQNWIGGELSPCTKYWTFDINKCLAVWIDGNVSDGTKLELVFSSDGYALKGNEQGIAAFVKLGHTTTIARAIDSEALKLVSRRNSKASSLPVLPTPLPYLYPFFPSLTPLTSVELVLRCRHMFRHADGCLPC